MVRHRTVGGGAAGERGLTPASPASPALDALLRPALQLAVEVARRGAGADPPVEPPRALRPFLRFSRLPDRAFAVVRRTLEEDAPFRERVSGIADEEVVGRPGWLFLTRPDGWDDELAELESTARAIASADAEEREDRAARRRLVHAQEAAQRAGEAARHARETAAKAVTELAAERRDRRASEEARLQLAERVAALEVERDGAEARAEEAEREVEALRETVAELDAEVRALRDEAEDLRDEADALRASQPATDVPAGPQPSPGTGGEDGATTAAADAKAALAAAVATASAAAAALGEALARAAAALDHERPLPDVDLEAPPGARTASGGAAGGPPPSAGPGPGPPAPGRAPLAPRRSRPRRRPAALPPAVFDDSPEAAAHLVRVSGVVVLVDGYNVAKALWPDLPVPDLRERLVDALSELSARTGADVHVVFDGADLGPASVRPTGRAPVRVTFSPAGVEADDVILELVDATPAERAVVVASSDRRVQDGAGERGANVVSSHQLGAILGR